MVRAAVLQSGRAVTAEAVVNAVGTWAPDLAVTAGTTLPVEPMRRYVHNVETTANPTPAARISPSTMPATTAPWPPPSPTACPAAGR